MGRIKVGIIGGGTIAQVEHVPNLLRLADRFDVRGLCDPSASTRAFVSALYRIATFHDVASLLALDLDAVVIASPDPLHKEHAIAALKHGLHVFCEKPLCYSPEDIEELVAARDSAKRVLQVGYMKRFDPAYEALLHLLPARTGSLRQISVEVVDADAWPFVMHHNTHRAEDVPASLIDETRRKQADQVSRALGILPAGDIRSGFVSAYSSSLVHDVNAVHGMLDVLEITKQSVVGAAFFGSGRGGMGTVELLDGQAMWTMSHLSVSTLPYYHERISLHFDDLDIDLEFPSPYLNHQPTRLTVRRGAREQLYTEQIHTGFKEAFVEELVGFWSAITQGTAIRNTAEHAARDMKLLCDLTRWQIGSHQGVKS